MPAPHLKLSEHNRLLIVAYMASKKAAAPVSVADYPVMIAWMHVYVNIKRSPITFLRDACGIVWG